jgi:hypothetical protein
MHICKRRRREERSSIRRRVNAKMHGGRIRVDAEMQRGRRRRRRKGI